MAKPPKSKAAAAAPRANPKPAAQSKKPDKRGTPKGKGAVRANGGKIGNPAFVPTDEQRVIVRTHAACGTPHWLIAEQLTPPISVDTLNKYFRNELDTGLLQVNARMASLIAKQGLGGCRTSQRLWMVTRGGWSMKSSMEHSGPDGAPIPVQGVPARNPNLRLLTDEDLKLYEQLQAKLEGLGSDSDV